MSEGLAESRELVDRLFHQGHGAQGRLKRLDEGTVAFPHVLFRFTVENEAQERLTLQLYKEVGAIGGELWDQEMRTLRNLAALEHPALPILKEGRREGEEAAWVLTDAAQYNLAVEGVMGYMAQNPRDALRQLLVLGDALGQLHSRGIWHRNLWPGTVEVAAEPDPAVGRSIALRLARFEMSAMLENLLRRVDRPLHDRQEDLRTLYRSQGWAALACCPPERIAFLFPGSQDQDNLEDGRSDIYSLGMLAYQWFVDPEPELELASLFTEQYEQNLLKRLLSARQSKVASRSGLPVELRKLLARMIHPDRTKRATSDELMEELAKNYAHIAVAWGESPPARRFLVSVTAPEFHGTLHDWGMLATDPRTQHGFAGLKAFIEDDLQGGELAYSSEGFAPLRPGSAEPELKEAKWVLMGRQVAYFVRLFEVKDPDRPAWAGGAIERSPHAMQVRYVANLAWRNAEFLRRESQRGRRLLRPRLPPLEVVALQSSELEAKKLLDRPRWTPLLDAAEQEPAIPQRQREFEAVLTWLLDVERVRLQARQYAFIREGSGTGKYVTLLLDVERDLRRIYGNDLLNQFCRVGHRPAFGDFFENDPDSPQVLYRQELDGRPDSDRSRQGQGFFKERVNPQRIVIERHLDTPPVPEFGWLSPAEDLASFELIRRQTLACEELVRNPELLQQLDAPRTRKQPPQERWKKAGQGLRGTAPEVIEELLNSHPFFAVHGPPGTGKTAVAAHSIQAALRDDPSQRFLVAAQSHYSLDNMAERVLHTLDGSAATDPLAARDFLAVRIASDEAEAKVAAAVRPYLPRELARLRLKEIERRCAERLATRGDSPAIRRIVGEWRAHAESSQLEILDRLRRGANLVFSTTGAATLRNLAGAGEQDRFDWVIIEEAAKAWLTELAIPLVRGSRWTLIGDHFQLQAFDKEMVDLLFQACADHPKLKERVVDKETFLKVFDIFGHLFELADDELDPALRRGDTKRPLGELKTQFRMRKPIADLVGRIFYPKGLDTDPSTEREHGLECPAELAGRVLVWLDTSEITACFEEPRWKNRGEAAVVARLVEQLHPKPPAGEAGVHRLAVLTPYRQQLEELQNLLVERTAQLHTVDSFQGKEAEVVVVSLVRKNARQGVGARIGYLSLPARVNVLLSRAQLLLVLVGDYEHFRNTEDPTWRAVCRELRRLGAVLDAESVLGRGERRHPR